LLVKNYEVRSMSAEVMGMTPDRPQKETRTVLVMDDDSMIREIAVFLLDQLGYEAQVAANGEEALALYERQKQKGNPFDAVILDIRVESGMGGAETMRHLLAMDPSAKAVVSSGSLNDPLMINFTDYGFSNVLPKPYGVKELARTLSGVIPEGAAATLPGEREQAFEI
jgi:two-component system cell cycle sensor histidine kinase/response regulator CckA